MRHAAPRMETIATRVSPEIRLVAASAVTPFTSTICLRSLSTHDGETGCEMIAREREETAGKAARIADR